MDKIINIKVRNRIAIADPGQCIICGNEDYVAVFEFDDEWNEIETKTARFYRKNNFTDVIFTGNEVNIPEMVNVSHVKIGVFAGDMTTTPAVVRCYRSILCDGGNVAEPDPDVYDQIIKMIENLKVGEGGEGGGPGVSPTVEVVKIEGGHRITITDINGTSSIDVMDGSDGLPGEPGADGKDGEKGDKGDTGAQGIQGEPGEKGETGAKGADGKTPVKGVDYFTPADQEAVVQQVIAALGMPVFGRVDADNNIILTGELADGTYTIKYEDGEGNVTEIGTLEQGASYTNLADPSGADWLTDKRLNSSAEIKDQTGSYVTNYIQVKTGDVVRVRGLDIREYGGGNNATTHFYNADKNRVSSITPNYEPPIPITLNGAEFTITINSGLTDAAAVRYVRFTGILFSGYTVDDIVITVNEPIE